ncbi:glycosyltransferase [Stappia sp.]|uniref:glycosyltransferase n=1 Tax=Stappia sp. TaxID=1870903 RepID=UPI003A99ACDC
MNFTFPSWRIEFAPAFLSIAPFQSRLEHVRRSGSQESSNMSSELISILFLNKNNADHLETAIKTILLQSDVNIEVIVADGGSTDGSLEIMARYPELTVLEGADRSRADGVKRATRAARGKYIAFMTSTDGYLGPHWLSHAVAALNADPETSLIWGASANMETDGTLRRSFYPPNFRKKYPIAQKRQWLLPWITDDGKWISYFSELSYVVRADVFRSIMLGEEKEPRLEGIDPVLDFHFEFIKQGYLPLYLNELANFGRKHPGQHQVSNQVGSWVDVYNEARKDYRRRLLASGQAHIWRDAEGREIGRIGSTRLKAMIALTRLFRLKPLQPLLSRALGLFIKP